MARNENNCVICGTPYIGRRGLACHVCVRIVKEHHEAKARGAETSCSVYLHNHWVSLGDTSDAMKFVEKCVIELFNGFPQISYGEPGYEKVEPITPAPYDFFSGGGVHRAVPKPQAQAVANLAAAIRQAIKAAEVRGKREGTNLLAQLAAGELTSAEFERRSGVTPK